MSYLALGDSITAGYGATAPRYTYVARLARVMQTYVYRSDHPLIIARNGWTSANLLAAVSKTPLPIMRSANVVTILIGGNDLIHSAPILLRRNTQAMAAVYRNYGINLKHILNAVRRSSRARVIVATQYNPFPHSPAAAVAVSQLNSVIVSTAARCGAAVAPVAEAFEGKQQRYVLNYHTGTLRDVFRTAILPIHPNDAGYAAIASAFASVL